MSPAIGTCFTEVSNGPKTIVITVAGRCLLVVGHNTVTIDDNKAIKQILYVSDVCKIFLFVGELVDQGLRTLFGSKKC